MELRVLVYLSNRPAIDVSREELLRKVWGYAPGVVSRAVDTTVGRLRAKVEADPTAPRHLFTVRGIGYRFQPLPALSTESVIRVPGPPPSRLFGRDEDLRELTRLIGRSRMLTVLGPAGVGKTRLCLEYLAQHSAPIVYAEVATCTDAESMAAQVAEALGLRLARGETGQDQVAAALSLRRELLVVLDNAEQLDDQAAAALSAWCRHAQGVRFLVSSRRRLRIAGEQCLVLAPLGEDQAVALFRDRCAAMGAPLDTLDQGVRLLVRRLDGLPLALELAASWARMLSPGELAERLVPSFALLSNRAVDASERHASLAAAFRGS
jgi:predicted ATPase